MSVRVLFFGSIADRLHQRECSLPASVEMTVADVLSTVACDDLKPLLVAVNQEQVSDLSTILKDGDEVALMPPFSGG